MAIDALPALPQFLLDPPVSVEPLLHDHLLDGIPQRRVGLAWGRRFPMPVKSRPAHSAQLAHSFDAEAALPGPFRDQRADRFPPHFYAPQGFAEKIQFQFLLPHLALQLRNPLPRCQQLSTVRLLLLTRLLPSLASAASLDDEYARYPLDAFDLIAKEERKYGLNMCLATQRPRDVSEGVLSQIGTLIVHRLTNDRDREVVERASGDIDRSVAVFLPTLSPGEAVIIGVDFPFPVTVAIQEPALKPDSKGPDYQATWSKTPPVTATSNPKSPASK